VRDGRKSWLFRYKRGGKLREMGLGAYDDVKLGDARELRAAMRKILAQGKDPLEERRLEEERRQAAALAAKATSVSFGEFAESVADALAPRAPKVRKAWLSMMTQKVGALAQMAPAEIQVEHVLAALKPYWQSRPETGRRMRMRIERILDAACARQLIPEVVNGRAWKNPARLKGHLDLLLARHDGAVQHHLAMPYDEVPQFMAQLATEARPAAPLLRFIILTAARNGEARGATWAEVDFEAKLWTVPAERMKMRRPHRVPLTDAALAVLESMKPADGSEPDPEAPIFPCKLARNGRFSENACGDLMADMGWKGRATPHGFRSAFRDWAGDRTSFPRDVIETCLAHLVGDATERAYRRGDALEKRSEVMEAWAKYVSNPPPKSNVVRPRFGAAA
jgi:integrase